MSKEDPRGDGLGLSVAVRRRFGNAASLPRTSAANFTKNFSGIWAQPIAFGMLDAQPLSASDISPPQEAVGEPLSVNRDLAIALWIR
jgi:hypothetical protein